jgi:hypothetical protein
MSGVLALALLAVYFLGESWRKWPDPIIDAGPQWYAIWRVSQGAAPYHDFIWNYGPLSLACNGLLFKCFGAGMMVLVTANLVVYGLIVTLAYVAFRVAWGWLAAFSACAVFIAVFSFSILNGVGNYNYVTPYTHEATHGILLMLAAIFIAARWCRKSSATMAFLLGLCGGMAAVMKPEFMLAGGVMGIAALLLRHRQKQPARAAEYGLLAAGVVLPTLVFTVWFARWESWKAGLIDSCQAWWLVLVSQPGSSTLYQTNFLGTDHLWLNAAAESRATRAACLIVAMIWAAGWMVNRPWPWRFRIPMALAATAVACSIRLDNGWLAAGRCLPGLILIVFFVVLAGVRRDLRREGRVATHHLMALLLVLFAGTMLARMPLNARINHFGFFQAAFAGMVAAAAIVAEVPRWTGSGAAGRRLAALGSMVLLATGCAAVAARSSEIRADQTQAVATGLDRFYAFGPAIDETAAQVNWCVEHLRSIPPDATLQVLPEGTMINYLSRHRRPALDFQGDEAEYVKQLSQSRPDYVAFITRDLREYGITRFGAPGHPGEKIVAWLRENYVVADSLPGGSKGASIWRRKSSTP